VLKLDGELREPDAREITCTIERARLRAVVAV
jgi:hypothetical protein